MLPEMTLFIVGVPMKCGLAVSTVVMKEEDNASPSVAVAMAYIILVSVAGY